MRKIIVFRFSAMGDVSLTVPVIKGVLDQNPDLEITLLRENSSLRFSTAFQGSTSFFPILKEDIKEFLDYTGFIGILRNQDLLNLL